jgi:hypothetical protein
MVLITVVMVLITAALTPCSSNAIGCNGTDYSSADSLFQQYYWSSGSNMADLH